MSAPPHAGTYADAYSTYLASGLGGPLPLRPGTKWPPPTGWTGWDGDYPSAADCAEWATEHHDYRDTTQLGLRLASTVIAIDVDAYDGKRGADTMREALTRWGSLPPGPWSTAREDGRSAIRPFRVPDGTVLAGKLALTLPSGEEVSDVEIIQAHHRYMLCAPSIHPKTGARYRWYDTAGPDAPPNLDELPELPAPWLEALSRAAYTAENVEPGQVREFIAALPAGPPCPPVGRVADAAVLAVRDAGSRHDTMLANVLRVLRLGEQGHTGATAALERMRDALVSERVTDGTGTRGSANGEFDRMVYGNHGVGLILASPTSVMDKGCCPAPTEPAGTSDPGPGPEVDDEDSITHDDVQDHDQDGPGLDPTAVKIMADKLRVHRAAKRLVDAEEMGEEAAPGGISLRSLLNEPDVPQPWRISKLWPIGGKVLLVAPKKTGKTTTVGNLIKSLADGAAFLGKPGHVDGFGAKPIEPGRKIVLFDFEMSREQLKRWLRAHNIRNLDAVHVELLRGRRLDLRDRRARKPWADALRELGAEILIVDPLASATAPLNINESDNGEMGAYLHAIDALVAECGGTESFVTHHAGKQGDDGRGASSIEGWPDATWRLMREHGDDGRRSDDADCARFFKAEGRDVGVHDTLLEFDPASRQLWFGTGTRKTHAVGKHGGAVLDLIRKTPDMSRNELRDAVRTELGLGTEGFGPVITALKNSGAVHVHPGARRKTGYHAGGQCLECGCELCLAAPVTGE